LQNNALLVFCWPLKLPDGSAFKLASAISNLLCNVMGPLDDWLQDKRLDADHPKVGPSCFQPGVSAHSNNLLSEIMRIDPAIETSSMSYRHVLHQAAADSQADLQVTSQVQDLKTRTAAAGTIESCLTPAAGHQFDLLIGSVFHQLCVNGWHASALSTLFPTGVPAITGSQQASPLGLAVVNFDHASSSSISSANLAQTPKHALTPVSPCHENQNYVEFVLCMAQSQAVHIVNTINILLNLYCACQRTLLAVQTTRMIPASADFEYIGSSSD